MVNSTRFFNRDLSWLSFNERVLNEAGQESVPLMERFRFLSIYSSNLDEFYRVRIPSYTRKKATEEELATLEEIKILINRDQNVYGSLIRQQLIPEMKEKGFTLLYDSVIPKELETQVAAYFLNEVAGYIQKVDLESESGFFPLNNHLYKAVLVRKHDILSAWILNIPSNHLPRFSTFIIENKKYILFLDDVIDFSLHFIFRDSSVVASSNVKLTRDASLKIIESVDEDTADVIEKELSSRDLGKATRFLYDPGTPQLLVDRLRKALDLKKSAMVAGGRYHNLRDFGSIPLADAQLEYPIQLPIIKIKAEFNEPIFELITKKDILVHPPYHSYECILRFFNEAALDPAVSQIYITLYRIAHDSRIGHALISAAKNGKEVFVVVELKARFDEANNIRWAKSMKAAGIKIVYSENDLKVHAKIALIKRKHDLPLIGLLATGNFNESTAKIYTDHILLTAHQPMLSELNSLFQHLIHEKKIRNAGRLPLNFLLVAQFNLFEEFIKKIDREISNAKSGLHAGIVIKLNNLEEEALIQKLYDASNAGVIVQLLIRGICRLVPGIAGQSQNITVHRIIDRYLEHGRVFIFENAGEREVLLGSSDWMVRNIHHRIEVCFPVLDADLKMQIQDIIQLQLDDNVQAVTIDHSLQNIRVKNELPSISSQAEIYKYLMLI